MSLVEAPRPMVLLQDPQLTALVALRHKGGQRPLVEQRGDARTPPLRTDEEPFKTAERRRRHSHRRSVLLGDEDEGVARHQALFPALANGVIGERVLLSGEDVAQGGEGGRALDRQQQLSVGVAALPDCAACGARHRP